MPKCPHCDREVAYDATFCPNCGKAPSRNSDSGDVSGHRREGLALVVVYGVIGAIAGLIAAPVGRIIYWDNTYHVFPSPEWTSTNLLTGLIIGAIAGLAFGLALVLKDKH